MVCHEHGHSDHLDQRRIDRLRRHVDRFVMVSDFIAELWLESGLDPDKVDVVFNGVDPAEYPLGGDEERSAARHALGLGQEPFVVTYFGRLDREKGVHVLLEAWRQLDFGPDEARLLVVGSSTVQLDAAAYQAELHALATDTVRFIPGQRDVVTPLHASDVVVVPSVWQEPFGRTVIEALSTGRPVLASRVGGIPEILSGPLGALPVRTGGRRRAGRAPGRAHPLAGQGARSWPSCAGPGCSTSSPWPRRSTGSRPPSGRPSSGQPPARGLGQQRL